MLAMHVLAAAAFALAAATAAWTARGLGGAERRFLVFVAVGAAALGTEKVLRLADRVHEWLHRLGIPDPPLLNGLDDVIIAAGLGVATGVVVGHRAVFRDRAGLRRWAAAAGVLAAGGFAIDAFGPTGGWLPIVEELMEAGAALALAGAAASLRAASAWGATQGRRLTVEG